MEQNYFTFHPVLLTCSSGELPDNLDASREVVPARSIATSSANSALKSSPILLNAVKREVSEEALEQDGVMKRRETLILKGNTETHSHVTSSTSTNDTEKKVDTEERSNGSDATNSKVSTQQSTLGMYSF